MIHETKGGGSVLPVLVVVRVAYPALFFSSNQKQSFASSSLFFSSAVPSISDIIVIECLTYFLRNLQEKRNNFRFVYLFRLLVFSSSCLFVCCSIVCSNILSFFPYALPGALPYAFCLLCLVLYNYLSSALPFFGTAETSVYINCIL